MWECVGGAVIAGETSLEGAIREVKEEVGVDLDPARGRVVFSEICTTVNGKRYNEILDAWLFEYDGELCLENATTDEVAQCGWFSVEEIRELLDSGELVPGRKYFFEKIV